MTKKSILPVFIFAYFLAQAQSTVYHPFPEGDAVWNVKDHHNHAGNCFGGPITREISYFQHGDTLIGNNWYNQLYMNQFSYEGNTSICDDLVLNVLRGGLRNDTENKKIYFYDYSLNEERLLYDFSIAVGDPVLPGSSLLITSIDSVSINGDYRKRFNCNYNPPFFTDSSIIEGIGSVQGLLTGMIGLFEGYNLLLCFQNNGVTEFINPDVNSPCQMVHTGKIDPGNKQVAFIPNPLSGDEKIRIKQPVSDALLRIYNLQGKVVLELQDLATGEVKLDCRNLEQGLYTVQIFENDELLFSQKVLISPRE